MKHLEHLENQDRVFFGVASILRQYGLNELRFWTNKLFEMSEAELHEDLKTYPSSILADIYNTAKEQGLL